MIRTSLLIAAQIPEIFAIKMKASTDDTIIKVRSDLEPWFEKTPWYKLIPDIGMSIKYDANR